MAFGVGLGKRTSASIYKQQPQLLKALRDSRAPECPCPLHPPVTGGQMTAVSPHISPSHHFHVPAGPQARVSRELPASLGSSVPLISPARLIIGDLWSCSLSIRQVVMETRGRPPCPTYWSKNKTKRNETEKKKL